MGRNTFLGMPYLSDDEVTLMQIDSRLCLTNKRVYYRDTSAGSTTHCVIDICSVSSVSYNYSSSFVLLLLAIITSVVAFLCILSRVALQNLWIIMTVFAAILWILYALSIKKSLFICCGGDKRGFSIRQVAENDAYQFESLLFNAKAAITNGSTANDRHNDAHNTDFAVES